ncbi:RHS repeat-associated core domain-containing protein [Paractinoplanes globisporus]|uniref:RHS repeat-associated core domain-containing protein n=1 Tax=Paractinoplanes globisporus TaxID=113565 RepID=A0ABW6WK78_9ACTN|nr:RHS repeat-associated core domain-containing protein [Actinoplanes globisporus]
MLRPARGKDPKAALILALGLSFLLTACSAEEGTSAVQLHHRVVTAAARTAPKPAPAQRWGDASGLDPVAGGTRNTFRPPSEKSKYPPVEAPSLPANVAKNVAAPATKTRGFRADGSSKEITSRRGAHERTYANADGTETTEFSATPLNYRKADGTWAPIDSTLARDPAGGWRRGADSVGLWLADRADAAELVRVTLPGGGELAYGAAGARPVTATVKGDTARYAGVWSDVDVELTAQPGGVKETLVLGSARAAGSYTFPLRLTGLTAVADGDQVLLRDAAGATVATIPAGHLVDADGAVSTDVRYQLVPTGGGVALRVTADKNWLTAPGRAFPVRLDPPVLANGAASESLVVSESGSRGGGDTLTVGSRDGNSSASYLRFGGLVSSLARESIFSAQLSLVAYEAPSCKPRALSVHPVTESWSSSTNTTYPGPSVGGALATVSFAQGYVGLGQASSSCPVVGTVIDLGSKGRDLVQGWVDGKANNGISLRAPVSDNSAWKTIAGPSSANPPTLYVTHTPYNAKYSIPNPTPKPPVLQNQGGKVKVTVTNKSAMDWTPAGFQLVYRVYNAKTGTRIGQYVAAPLAGNVARGASTTLDATIRALPIGDYLIDFSMATTGGKVFTDELVPPARIALSVQNIPPVVGELFPPNGYQSPTLRPQLWAQGVDIDAPPSQTLQYKFEYCSVSSAGAPTGCTVSAYQAKQSFTVPASVFKWSTPYMWRAYVKDNTTEVVSAYSTLVTVAPQPAITSRVANAPYGTSDKEFDPDLGNYSTAAVDATAATAGPALSVTRSYNSLDPRRNLAFGAGWMSQLDLRVEADADGSGNALVTYADGQQVRFGRNPDGTFAAPPGRTAQLSIVNSAYVLKDLKGTTYTFRSGDGRISTIVDKYSRVLEFVYDSTGHLLRMQVRSNTNATPGRKLVMTWNTAGTHVTGVTTDLGGTWTYEYTGDLLTKVCSPGGASCTTYTYAAGSHYRSSVLDSGPASYWRLGEKAGAEGAASEVLNNLGKDAGVLRNVTLEQAGALLGTDDTAALFNGSNAVAELPKGVVKRSRDTAVEMWFKVAPSQTGGPLIGYQDTAVDTTPTIGVPLLYVGSDGHVYGQFKTTASAPAPIDGGVDVRDGKWHHVALSVSADAQTLYLDGTAHKPATVVPLDYNTLTFNQVGAAWATTPTAWKNWGSTSAKRYFNGSIDEVAIYGHALGDQAVKAHVLYGTAQADQLSKITLPSGKTSAETTYDTAADRVAEYTDGNGGTWKIGKPTVYGNDTDLRRAVEVRDPADRKYLYEYDALANRPLRTASPLGIDTRPEDKPLPATPSPTPTPTPTCVSPDPSYPTFCTTIPGDSPGPIFSENELTGSVIRSFGYDDKGRQNQVVDENGNVLTMTFDDRGNVTSRKTCRKSGDCQTSYTSYTTPNASNPFDPKNDLPIESRDPRSSGATDNKYRTVTAYNNGGDVYTETRADGAITTNLYTGGNEIGYGSTTDTVPAGLTSSTTDVAGRITRYRYTAAGDLALVTSPTGLVTEYTYDALGRKTQEKVTSDSYPSGVVTTFTYDDFGHPLVTIGPITTNAVDGTRHQAITTNTYDVDGNLVRTSIEDALDATEPERVTTIEYDDHNHPTRTVNPEGDEQTEGWDKFGNRTSVVDGNGNRYGYAFTARNKLAEVRLYDYRDGHDNGADYVVLNSYAYDYGGRMAVQIDSMGRRTEYTYLGDDKLAKVVLKNFHNPDGSTRDYVLEDNTYDAAGNLTKSVIDNGTHTTTNSFDSLGRTATTAFDPTGLNRATTYQYDLLGNVTRTTTTGNTVNVPWLVQAGATNVVSRVYNAKGQLEQEKELDGTASRSTTYAYDQRGLTLSVTDPRGGITTFGYDENGDRISSTAPTVGVESGGNPAQSTRPTVATGYNAFGEATAVKDALGNVSHTKYDRMGRAVESDGPAYTAPAGPNVSGAPILKTKYDALGNVVETTDAKQHVTRYTYDRLNHVVQKDEPGSTDTERLVTKYTYTRTGKALSTVSPTGIRAEATYDDLDRKVTTTAFERKPTARTLTTTTAYDDAGNAVQVTSPTGLVTKSTYDAAGDQLSVTDPAGVPTQQGYDGFGNAVRQSDGAGRTTRHDFNAYGDMITEINLAPDGTELRRQTYDHDNNGNVTAVTDALQKKTTFEYDPLDHLVKQVEPKSATASITTTFGYDAAGNRTRYTDGNGNATYYGVNSLGLTESVTEPATTAHPALSDRRWLVAYDLNGNATTMVAPGGVTRSRTFDAADRLIDESGSGGGTAGASRGLAYDQEGRTTGVTSGGGSANTFGYDDRGDLLSATGPSGNSTFSYDDDGSLTGRTDAAGTATFGYAKGRLSTMKDGTSGVTQTVGYDAAGVVKSIDYGAGRVRGYGYDNLGRLTTDTLKNSAGGTVSSITYAYDLADNVTGKNTTGTAGAGNNTYGYDDDGRLTSWTSSAGTVAYAYDDAGNRTRAGTKTATYDQRNRLLGDGDYTYAYTPRGTMASRTSSGLTDTYSFDAFDRMVGAEGQTYVYDGLNRLINRNGALFAYSGTDQDPVSDGTEKYGRGPDGSLLSVSSTAGGVKLTISDEHDDVVGAFEAGSSLGALDSSTAYDPFGTRTSTAGAQSNVGFQGDWTDPATGQVDMGARWYDPGTAAFLSRDTVDYTTGDAVLANKYAYAADDPLGNNDPTGNWPSCGWCKKAISQVSSVVSTGASYVWSGVQTAYHATTSALSSAGSWLYNQASAGLSALKRGWDYAYGATKNFIKSVGHSIVDTWNNTIRPTLSRAKQWAKAQAKMVYQRSVAIAQHARAAISYTMQHVSLKSVGAMVKSQLKSMKLHISANIMPSLVASFSNVTQDLGINSLLSGAASVGGMLMSGLSAAGDWVADHKAEIIGGLAGAVVGVGCGALIGWTGVGAIGCGFLSGAAGSLVTDLVAGDKGWKEMGADALMGGVTGAVMGPLSEFGGGAVSSGARTAVTSGSREGVAIGTGSATRAVAAREAGGAGEALAGRSAGTAGRDAVESSSAGGRNFGARAENAASCAGANSFAAGTLVLMADGSTKRIEDVRIGDKVVATDPTTGRTGVRVVTALIVGVGEKQMVELTVDLDGDKGGKTATVDATDGHPFWAPDLHRWVDAGDLKPGAMLRTGAGTYVQVTATKKWTAQQKEVHNLTVDGLHTYYVVVGGRALLVHNAGSTCPVHGGATGVPNRDLVKPQECTCPGGRGRVDNDAPGLDEGAPETANRRIELAEDLKTQRTKREAVVRGAKGEVEAVKDHTDPVGGILIIILGVWAKAKRALID